jgi:DNA-binding HxlR family transcriptional regulator
MLHRTYEGQNCSIARTLEFVGERWTLLILRNIFVGIRRFDEIQENLGVSRNILTDRLHRLCEVGIAERRLYQRGPDRFEYYPTDKGKALWPVNVALMHWGDRYLSPAGPPIRLLHRDCGGEVTERRVCSRCGRELGLDDIDALPGPGTPR